MHVFLKALEDHDMSTSELMEHMGLKHRAFFRENYLHPALEQGYIQRTIPDKPSSRRQKYRLTDKGRRLLSE
ncbi:MAG: Fic family protein [Desulfovermiculus sp.]